MECQFVSLKIKYKYFKIFGYNVIKSFKIIHRSKNERKTEYKLKDSGERQVFNTGAQRDVPFGKGNTSLFHQLPLKE